MQMVIETTVDDGTPVAETLSFSYDASGMPISVVYNGTAYFYTVNLQGDVVGIVNQNGNIRVSYTYDAWGNLLSTTGGRATTVGKYNPLRYRGYVYDLETSLYYLQSRYYDPEVGRFINADAFTSTGQGILGNNMFAYCNNCPVKYKDPDGHELVTATAVVIVIEAVLIVATVAIISYCVATLLVELSGWLADSLHQITWANIEYAKEVAEPEPPDVTYPGDDPKKAPGEDYEWKGKEPVGGDEGSWVNNKTGEQLHPDLNHKPGVDPHYDYTDGTKPKIWWRIFGDGRIELRK